MNTYIVQAFPFPYVMGREKMIKVISDNDIDTVLKEVKLKLETEAENYYEHDIYGWTLEEFIKGLETITL